MLLSLCTHLWQTDSIAYSKIMLGLPPGWSTSSRGQWAARRTPRLAMESPDRLHCGTCEMHCLAPCRHHMFLRRYCSHCHLATYHAVRASHQHVQNLQKNSKNVSKHNKQTNDHPFWKRGSSLLMEWQSPQNKVDYKTNYFPPFTNRSVHCESVIDNTLRFTTISLKSALKRPFLLPGATSKAFCWSPSTCMCMLLFQLLAKLQVTSRKCGAWLQSLVQVAYW